MAAYRGALFLIVLGLVPQLLCRHAELSQIHSDIGRGGSTPRADRIEPLMGVSDHPGGGRHTDERATFPVGSLGAVDFQCTRSLIQLAAKAAAMQHLAQNEARTRMGTRARSRTRKCILTVKPPVMSQDSTRVVEIAGLDGEPVLRACVRHPPLWPQLGEGTGSTVPQNFSPVPSITLHEPTPVSSASGPEQLSALQLAGSAVATCFGGTTADGRRRMFMYDPYGQFAGSLARDGDGLLSRYVFATSRGDDWMALDGIFANHAVLISNRHLELLADTEPCRTSGDGTYNLRGNGGVDVGLILLCLIAIREMEAPDDS